jgi:N6-adenosine-specific RNA methylase IME4/ParB-like chromosome segregation protein Spo0J
VQDRLLRPNEAAEFLGLGHSTLAKLRVWPKFSKARAQRPLLAPGPATVGRGTLAALDIRCATGAVSTPRFQVMPPLSLEDYAELKADIATRGMQVPVEYDEGGEILDGHHRVQICEELGIAHWPRLVRLGLSNAEKREHARKLNLARRHLDQQQKRALVEEQLRDTPERSNRQIAAALGVDGKTVGTARERLEGTAEIPLLEKTVGADGKKRPKAYRFADPSPEGRRGILESAKAIRSEDRARRYGERIANIAQKAASNTPLPADQKYPAGLFDPPWKFNAGLSDRSAENHYPTMDPDEIEALPIPDCLTKDALLALWTTVPHIHNALRIVERWGFTYSSLHTWDKQIAGTGHWLRNQTEHLILATRGDFPAPLEGMQWTSFLSERKGRHSAKPLRYYELIEAYTPGLVRIEGFSRLKEPRPGWVHWGNEAPPSARPAPPLHPLNLQANTG